MNQSSNLIAQIIMNPTIVERLTLSDWGKVIRQGRATNLLYKLLKALEVSEGLLDSVPAAPRKHLLASKAMGDRFAPGLVREIEILNEIFQKIELPLVLMKGAAYVCADFPVGNGRIFSDIDLLVPKEKIELVEKRLKAHGWFSGAVDKYNDRYYRQWMHEIPPLTHINRGTVLDVHHAILPETANLKPDSKKIYDSIVPVEGLKNVYVLCPVDMVLHSATHLFQDGEFENGLRDLLDLHGLLDFFSTKQSSFWSDLIDRSLELGLQRPLYYALRYCSTILNTPIPQFALKQLNVASPLFPFVSDFFFMRALMPAHSTCDDYFTGFARWGLYVRSHHLRMPIYLLLPHLLRKSFMRFKDKNHKEIKLHQK